jgi:hypothetical protein
MAGEPARGTRLEDVLAGAGAAGDDPEARGRRTPSGHPGRPWLKGRDLELVMGEALCNWWAGAFAAGHTVSSDSPLEGTGFEPSVPRDTTNLSSRLWLVPANRKVGAKANRHTKRRALPPRNRWFESCSLQRGV